MLRTATSHHQISFFSPTQYSPSHPVQRSLPSPIERSLHTLSFPSYTPSTILAPSPSPSPSPSSYRRQPYPYLYSYPVLSGSPSFRVRPAHPWMIAPGVPLHPYTDSSRNPTDNNSSPDIDNYNQYSSSPSSSSSSSSSFHCNPKQSYYKHNYDKNTHSDTHPIHPSSSSSSSSSRPPPSSFYRYTGYAILASLISALLFLLSLLLPFLQRELYSQLVIEDSDEAFHWIMHWLSQHEYGRRTTHVAVLAHDGGGSGGGSGGGAGSGGILGLILGMPPRSSPPPPPSSDESGEGSDGSGEAPFRLVPAPGLHLLQHNGHWVVVEFSRREQDRGHIKERVQVWVPGQRREVLEDLVATAHRIYRQHTHRHTAVYTPDADCYTWSMAAQRPRRETGSVVLRRGVLDDLLADGQSFLAAAGWYRGRGIPYRRGYLLHGPPGTGKTSAVLALAGRLGLDVCAVSLASPEMTDDRLSTLLRKAPGRSVLLLEDVDCALGADSRLSLSAILNALDGVAAQEGRLLVMTTNHPERLSPAMVRPGRVDKALHIGAADGEQIERYFRHFYGHVTPEGDEGRDMDMDMDTERLARIMARRLEGEEVTVAMLQGHLLRFRDDPVTAVERSGEIVQQDTRSLVQGAM